MSPTSRRCVILVPVGSAIDSGCEDALRELERRGYAVWRVRGYSAIDAARNQMASDALAQCFDELMWIDSDPAIPACGASWTIMLPVLVGDASPRPIFWDSSEFNEPEASATDLRSLA